MADLLSAFEALFDRNPHVDAEFFRDSVRFSHDRRRHFTRLATFDDLDQGRPGERADRIVGDVAHQLHPHVVTNVRAYGTTQAGFDERAGNAPAAFAL